MKASLREEEWFCQKAGEQGKTGIHETLIPPTNNSLALWYFRESSFGLTKLIQIFIFFLS